MTSRVRGHKLNLSRVESQQGDTEVPNSEVLIIMLGQKLIFHLCSLHAPPHKEEERTMTCLRGKSNAVEIFSSDLHL